jgi:hypothetical protein
MTAQEPFAARVSRLFREIEHITPNKTILRHSDGTPVTHGELADLIESNDERVSEFLDLLIETALRSFRLQKTKSELKESTQ